MNRQQRRAAQRAEHKIQVHGRREQFRLGDPHVRIAAVTGEDPDAILGHLVRMIEAGYETDEVTTLVDRAVESGMTVQALVERILGPE